MGEMPKGKKNSDTGRNIGCEAELWKAADALRGSMDAAEYKHGTRQIEGNQHAHR
jgi:type I restriction-modification system DNA methylase subunit